MAQDGHGSSMITHQVDHVAIHNRVLRAWQSWQGMGGVDVSPVDIVYRVGSIAGKEMYETLVWRFPD